MHTFKGKNCVIHYNSDMSGDVTITTKDGKLDVFGEDLLRFISSYIVSEKIAELEIADPVDLLKRHIKL